MLGAILLLTLIIIHTITRVLIRDQYMNHYFANVIAFILTSICLSLTQGKETYLEYWKCSGWQKIIVTQILCTVWNNICNLMDRTSAWLALRCVSKIRTLLIILFPFPLETLAGTEQWQLRWVGCGRFGINIFYHFTGSQSARFCGYVPCLVFVGVWVGNLGLQIHDQEFSLKRSIQL